MSISDEQLAEIRERFNRLDTLNDAENPDEDPESFSKALHVRAWACAWDVGPLLTVVEQLKLAHTTVSVALDEFGPEPEERTMTTPEEDAKPFAEWAIVEMLGHRRVAGHIREIQIAGAGFLRLDIPEAGDDPARTQYLSPASIYALHPVGEDTARKAAQAWRPEPVSRWDLRSLPAATERLS